MINSPLIKEAIKNSAEMVTELGAGEDAEALMTQATETIKERLPQAFHHCMGMELHDLAGKNGISIGQLETIQEQYECNMQNRAVQENEYQKSLFMNPKNQDLREKAIKYPEFYLYECMEAWQLGDEEAFQTSLNSGFYGNSHIPSYQRNTNWLNGKDGHPGLLEKLDSSPHSVCVAVGTAHLFGDQGLIKAFQQHHGLTVERMHSVTHVESPSFY